MVEYLRPMVEEVIDKKLAGFSEQFEKLKSELNANFDGLKEQMVTSTSAVPEEVASVCLGELHNPKDEMLYSSNV